MKKTTLSHLLLILTTFLWGFSFLVVQDSFDQGWTPFMLIFSRGLLAGLVSLPFIFKRKWWNNWKLWKDALISGVAYFIGFVFQGYGQLYSSISNAAFLTTLNVVMIPIILFIFTRKKLAKKLYFAIFFSLLGTGVLAFVDGFSFHIGDIYLIIGALGFAFQIIFATKAASHHEAFATASIQAFTISILGGLAMVFTKQVGSFPTAGYGGILYIGLVATGLCGIFQMFAQRYVSESTTSIIYSFEAAVAALGAVIFAYQDFSWRIIIGGFFLLLAVLIAEINFQKPKILMK